MNFTTQIVAIDILRKEEVIATAVRLANGCWHFRDLRNDRFEISSRPLEEGEIVAEYRAISRRRNAIARAKKELTRKGK